MAHGVEAVFRSWIFEWCEFARNCPPLEAARAQREISAAPGGRAHVAPNIASRRKTSLSRAHSPRFLQRSHRDYVRELLSPEAVRSAALFQPRAVSQLVAKLELARRWERWMTWRSPEFCSSQLVHQQFVANFRMPASTFGAG